MYTNRKEIAHVKIGEESKHHIYTYISKISIIYVKMVTRPVYKKLKETPKTTRR